MAITLTSTSPALVGIDFMKYVKTMPVITRGINIPSTFDMTLSVWGEDFVLPSRGDYFTFATTAEPKMWTGFITEAPELIYEGKRSSDQLPVWSWSFKGTSDDYILNLAPLGLVPVYINQTQGGIIKDLADRIAPGKFDVTNVLDGQLVPFYLVDPSRTFGEIIKEFAESAYYRFWANDFKLYYERQDVTTAKLVVNGMTAYSNRVRILSSTNTSPIVITTESPHGRSNGDVISITNHLINTNANGNWFIQNVAGSTMELVGSTGNGVGGNTGWAGLHNPHFTPSRLQIGPVNDPVVNDAIIIGDIEPQGIINEYFVGDGFTNAFPLLSSIYGVDSALLLDEIFTGTVIDSNKWFEVDNLSNVLQVANGYLNVIGTVADAYGVYLQSKALIPLQGNLRLTHGEYDFVTSANDGVICSLWTATPNSSFNGCVYGIRVTSDGVNVILNPIVNGVVDTTQSYTAETAATNKRYIIRTLVNFDNIYRHLREYQFRLLNGTLGSYGGQNTSDKPTYRTIITEIDATTGLTTDSQIGFVNTGSSTGLGESTFFAAYFPVVSNDLHLTVSNITISVPMQVSLETLNKSVWLPQFNEYDPFTGAPLTPNILNLTWANKIIGPNEINSYDNVNPVATIITSRSGRIDSGNILGSTLYNPGDATLTFFKDSIKQITNTPEPGQIVHLKYRRAGIAIGRAQNTALITSEAAIWGDNGLRTITKKDLSPLPRTSLEAEMAAAAIVEENSYQHYAGTYTQFSNVEFAGNPMPGTILKFANLPSTFPSVGAELITQVVSTLETDNPELFTHAVTFGKADKVSKFLSTLKKPPTQFAPQDTAEVPTASDLDDILSEYSALSIFFNPITLTLTYGSTSTTLPDTALNTNISLRLQTWTSDTSETNYFVVDIGQAPPPGGGFEIRYADQGWGDPNNKNLLVFDTITNGQTTASSFKIGRSRNTVAFVKAFDSAGRYSRYASGIRIAFPSIPDAPSSIIGFGGTIDHPIFKANLPLDAAGQFELNTDIYGLNAFFCQPQPVTGWFMRNGATEAPFSPIGGDNPGPFFFTREDTGLEYPGNQIVLPGNSNIALSGFINFETNLNIVPGIALFFVWVRAISFTPGNILRLNIKDNLLPSESNVPFGFYSRHDHILNGVWQPLFSVARIDSLIINNQDPDEPAQYNLVLHNINSNNITIKFALPFLGTSFYKHADIVLGASNDTPGLNFTYDNTGTDEEETT